MAHEATTRARPIPCASRRIGACLALGLLAAAVALQGHSAAAQAVAPPVVIAAAPSMTARSLIGMVIDTVTYYAVYAWTMVTNTIAPPSPDDLSSYFDDHGTDSLLGLLRAAGYKLREVKTGFGLVPNVTLKFVYVRELSSADLHWVELQLERHEKLNTDLISAAQRSIIHTLIRINETQDYFVESLTVNLFPFPSATFTLEPWFTGLPEEFDILLRAIQGREAGEQRNRFLQHLE